MTWQPRGGVTPRRTDWQCEHEVAPQIVRDTERELRQRGSELAREEFGLLGLLLRQTRREDKD